MKQKWYDEIKIETSSSYKISCLKDFVVVIYCLDYKKNNINSHKIKFTQIPFSDNVVISYNKQTMFLVCVSITEDSDIVVETCLISKRYFWRICIIDFKFQVIFYLYFTYFNRLVFVKFSTDLMCTDVNKRFTYK